MSGGRADSINTINSKYGGSYMGSRFHQNAALPHVEVIPSVYQPVEKTEAVRAINYFDQHKVASSKGSKWLYFLLGTLILAAIIGGIYYFWNRSKNTYGEIVNPIEGKPIYTQDGTAECSR